MPVAWRSTIIHTSWRAHRAPCVRRTLACARHGVGHHAVNARRRKQRGHGAERAEQQHVQPQMPHRIIERLLDGGGRRHRRGRVDFRHRTLRLRERASSDCRWCEGRTPCPCAGTRGARQTSAPAEPEARRSLARSTTGAAPSACRPPLRRSGVAARRDEVETQLLSDRILAGKELPRHRLTDDDDERASRPCHGRRSRDHGASESSSP